MSLKNILPTIVIIACLLLLFLSYFSWKGKIDSVQGESTTSFTPPSIETPTNEDSSNEVSTTEEPSQLTSEELSISLGNADERIKQVFVDRVNKKEKVQFLIVGSEAMEVGNPGYAEQLKSALENQYSELIEVTIKPFDTTSDIFVNELMDQEIDWTTGYDVVLLEPFTLNNNGLVVIEDEHAHVLEIQTTVIEHVTDAVVVLNPAHPIQGATYYPTQIDALKGFAELNDIPFIDHWTAWPDHQTEEINQYLTEQGVPNEAGSKLWADQIINYFVAK